MKSLSTTVLAALAGNHVALAQLLSIDFAGGSVYLNTSNFDLTWLGITYKGGYGLGSISVVHDSPGQVQGMNLVLYGGDPLRLSLALDAADQVQGAVVTIRTAIIETVNYTILDAPVDWLGKCDTMSIGGDSMTENVAITVESKAVDLLRGSPSTYSDADQQLLYPGDLAFQYVVDQVDQPIIWPAREYFFK